MDLAIVSDERDLAHVKLRGKVTQRQVTASKDSLVDLLGGDAYRRKVLLDLSETIFLDSSGVTWLLISHKRFRQQGGQFVLCAVPPLVMKVLTMLRLQMVFDIAETLEDARQKMQAASP